MKIISVNKSASFEYFIEDKYEAGIVLEGSEVKSLRKNNCNLADSFCFIRNGRDRKLLLHKSEISKIVGKINEKGYTLVPLRIYFSQALVKVEVALCRGKHTFDKKKSLQERDLVREKERQIKEYLK